MPKKLKNCIKKRGYLGLAQIVPLFDGLIKKKTLFGTKKVFIIGDKGNK